MKLSVIMTTYNRPDALNAVLLALMRQTTVSPDEWEIIVADDGSAEPTRSVIQQFSKQGDVPVWHVWHPDNGFRAAEIRNRAAIRATGDYLVFLDGDCMPMPDFIAKHKAVAEPGKAVAGNRILLSKRYTSELLSSQNPIKPCNWNPFQWTGARWQGKVNKSVGWLRLDLEKWRDRKATDWRIFRSCNVGIWKKDFLKVDGFDAAFSGWGYEDSDLAVRLLRAGVTLRDGRFAVPVLHLWHADNDRNRQAENWKKFEMTLHGTHVRARQGVTGITP